MCSSPVELAAAIDKEETEDQVDEAEVETQQVHPLRCEIIPSKFNATSVVRVVVVRGGLELALLLPGVVGVDGALGEDGINSDKRTVSTPAPSAVGLPTG